MPKVLNSAEACEISMGEVSGTILEGTVRRIAEELGVSLEDTSGVSYIISLEGKKGDIKVDYHHDFDGYEAFSAFKNDSRFAIMSARGNYSICLKNRGKRLIEHAFAKPANRIEKNLNLRILIPDDIRSEPEKIHEPLVDINEAELGDITSQTILKYLS